MANFTPRNKLIINLINYEKNLQLMQKYIKEQSIIAVIKANAYGMGYEKILTILKKNNITKVAISCLQEALEVKKIFTGDISLLGDFLEDEISLLLEEDIIIPITSLEKAQKVNELAERKSTIKKVVARVQIYIDTGMGNLGIFHQVGVTTIKKIINLKNLKVEEIFTHFAYADNPEDALTLEQTKRFENLLSSLNKLIKLNNIKLHLSNSDATIFFPHLLKKNLYQFCRLGIALFGVSKKQIAFGLKPCLSFKSHLIAIKKISPPFSIGYAKTYSLKKTTTVGTISAGYADGVPFALGNQGRVIIRDKIYPIIGRLSMDYLTVDLMDNKKNLVLGEEVTLLGGNDQSSETILVEEWSKYKLTHPYDILCSFGSRRLDKTYIPPK